MAAKRDLVLIQRQILDAHEAAAADRARDARLARDDVRVLLGQHGLFTASFAMRCDVTASFFEFDRMRNTLRAGGFHRMRLTGGRTLDG
jgi:hypothetical protein